jgi:hypothetical protein
VVVHLGLGRHIVDPSVLPNIRQYSYILWIDQIVNVIAVAFLMVTALNFLAPVLTFLGCIPLEKSWNFAYQGHYKCWAVGGLKLSYTQGISNIVTDIVYMAAPLIYLSNVQLSRRTQWGIRVVFLLSIP